MLCARSMSVVSQTEYRPIRCFVGGDIHTQNETPHSDIEFKRDETCMSKDNVVTHMYTIGTPHTYTDRDYRANKGEAIWSGRINFSRYIVRNNCN